MFVGYARVSLPEQHLALQTDALQRAGCERLYTDTVSGGQTERPGLRTAPEVLRAEDTFVVWKLDRLGRSLAHLVETIQDLHQRGFTSKVFRKISIRRLGPANWCFISLQHWQSLNATSSGNEPVPAWLRRGHVETRWPSESLRPHQAARVRALYNARELSVPELCVLFGIGKTTVYRYLQHTATHDTISHAREALRYDEGPGAL